MSTEGKGDGPVGWAMEMEDEAGGELAAESGRHFFPVRSFVLSSFFFFMFPFLFPTRFKIPPASRLAPSLYPIPVNSAPLFPSFSPSCRYVVSFLFSSLLPFFFFSRPFAAGGRQPASRLRLLGESHRLLPPHLPTAPFPVWSWSQPRFPFVMGTSYLVRRLTPSGAHATLAVAPGQSGPLPGSPGPPCNRRFPAVSHCPAGNFADAQGQFGHFVPVGLRRCLFRTVRRACACGLTAASWEKWGIAEPGEWSPAQPALSVSRLWLANARHGIASGFGQFSLSREACLGEEGERGLRTTSYTRTSNVGTRPRGVSLIFPCLRSRQFVTRQQEANPHRGRPATLQSRHP